VEAYSIKERECIEADNREELEKSTKVYSKEGIILGIDCREKTESRVGVHSGEREITSEVDNREEIESRLRIDHREKKIMTETDSREDTEEESQADSRENIEERYERTSKYI
jgi:hypothetical protein